MRPQSDNSPAAVFAENRARLWSIAYRMLGSRAEADDAVQEAYLRWHDARIDEIRAPQAWLVTTTTRLCIDRLKQLRAERERYVGPWLPEPIVDEGAEPDQAASLASDLSVAMLAVLERLAPEERAAFLLHEMFDSGYDDIARILGKSEVACRQIVSRARKRVHEARPRVQVPEEAKRRVLDQFMRAIEAQDEKALLRLLAPDAAWTSDGGGKASAARRVLVGAAKVAKFGANIFRKVIGDIEFRPVIVNGEPGRATFHRGQLYSVWSIRTDGRRVLDVYVVMNPEKLAGVKVAH